MYALITPAPIFSCSRSCIKWSSLTLAHGKFQIPYPARQLFKWNSISPFRATSLTRIRTSLNSGGYCSVVSMLVNGDPIVSTEWLSDHLEDVCILDIRGRVVTNLIEEGMEKSDYVDCYNDYLEGHIPGAVFFNWLKDGVDLTSPVPVQLMVDSEQFASVMERKGVSTEKPVVVYDSGDGLLAPRLWWALRRHGHPSVHVLDGGYKKWMEEGREMELYEPCPLKIYATFKPLKPKFSLSLSSKELFSLISREKDVLPQEGENLKIVDARSIEQYKGSTRRSKHNGRIPGAISIPRRLFLQPSGLFKSVEEQRKVFTDAGLNPDRPTKLDICQKAKAGHGKTLERWECLSMNFVSHSAQVSIRMTKFTWLADSVSNYT